MKFDIFDAEMRGYEETLDQYIQPGSFMVARLDGHGFTRLTKELCSLEAPFDTRFRDCMADTVKSLMNYSFRIVYGYTQSDEISLLFHPNEDAFGRKVRKYNSLLAGVASTAFSEKLGYTGIFDCRMVPLPTMEAVRDYFLWRQEDAHRNALNAHCYWLLRKQGRSVSEATSLLEGKNAAYKKEFLMQNGIDYDSLPSWQKYGLGVYWKANTKQGKNPITGESETAIRRMLKVDTELLTREKYSMLIEELLQ